MTAATIKADWRIVKLSWTKTIGEKWLKVNNAKEVYAYYLTDFAEHVHLCELMPSLALEPIMYQIESIVEPETDEEREKRFETELELLQEDSVLYLHVRDAEKNPNKPLHFDMPERDEDKTDDEYRQECIDYAMEELHANQGWPF